MLAVVPLLAACNDPPAPAPKDTKVTDPKPPAPLEAAVWEWAHRDASTYEPSGPYFTEALETGHSTDHSVLLQNGRCARFFAVAEQSIGDLEIGVFDTNGSLVRQESSPGARAEIGKDHPICPPATGMYRVHVTARAGTGKYALRAYQSPW